MAEIHAGATLTPARLELLPEWMSRQRWYAAKGRLPRLTPVGGFSLDDPDGAVGVETLILADLAGPAPVVYQVPLTYRDAPLPGAEAALVGTTEHGVLGRRWVYDAPHDPVYAVQLLELVQGRAPARSDAASGTAEPDVRGTAHPTWTAEVRVRSSRVLRGEQSNTSVVYDTVTLGDGSEKPLICKVFRTLQPGDNPDVVVQGALAEAGCTRVPPAVGSVRGTWCPPQAAEDRAPAQLPRGEHAAYGHLAFAQEFLTGVEDAWRVATAALAGGCDFAGPARELGAATAEVHATLALAMPTEPVSAQTVAQLVAGMQRRYCAAAGEVPSLAADEPAVRRLFEAALHAKWPDLQRIHGDYHLGQVLQAPGRGWVLLDFEGEPLRPLAERNRPDQTIRDVAGMLRSFDYAGGSWEHAHPGRSAREWVQHCQDAFLDGYAEGGGRDPRDHAVLLAAFSLDKAMYEVVYEARNRPDWLTIPTAAIGRLLATSKELS